MMCYRGKLFCTFHKDCKDSKTCGRAYTKGVQEACIRWSEPILKEKGAELVCIFTDKPECFNKKEKS